MFAQAFRSHKLCALNVALQPITRFLDLIKANNIRHVVCLSLHCNRWRNAALVIGQHHSRPDIGVIKHCLRALSFTGSIKVGKLIAAKCVATVKCLVMELGGHAPLIILDDSNLDHAVEIGPMMHSRAVDKIEQHVSDTEKRGSRIEVGGKLFDSDTLFFELTLLTNVSDDAAIMHEETFGPVAAISVFDNEDEVIVRANCEWGGRLSMEWSSSTAQKLPARQCRLVAGNNPALAVKARIKASKPSPNSNIPALIPRRENAARAFT